MAAFAGDEPRRPLAPGIIVCLIAALAIAVVAGAAIKEVALAVALLTVFVVGHRTLLAWRSLIAALVLLIFFIPIKRYSLPASLPFELEPYRLFVAVLVIVWIASLLVDGRIRLVRT